MQINLYKIFLNIHSFVAFLFLLAIIVASVSSFIKVITKNYFFSETHRSLSITVFIMSHLQLLLGLGLLYTTGIYTNMSLIMKDAVLRSKYVEHPTLNIIAIILISIGYFKIKKADSDKSKTFQLFFFYSIAAILILIRIPWQQWINK